MPTGQVFRWHLRIMMQPMRHQRRGGEAELLGAQQRGDHDVAAGLQLAVGLHADAAAQVVHHQHLLRFGEAELPRNARMLDGAERRRARAAVVAADQHHVGMRLGDARGHRAHADFGHQLHRNARLRIDVLQIVDQLRQIFDRVDVVMRRRRDQAHAGNGVAHARDHLVHLVAGQLAAFAGLGALRHLDLQLVGVDQVIGGDAEAADATCLMALRRDRRWHRPKRASSSPPSPVLRLAADAVHRDGQRLVRFLARWSRTTWRRWRSASRSPSPAPLLRAEPAAPPS